MKKDFTKVFKTLVLSCAFAISNHLISQISITAVPFTPASTDFNSFNPNSASNATATIPAGWSLSSSGTPAYNGQSISGPSAGGYWSYTYLLSGDYNLGGLRDASVGNITYHVDYVNNTGGLITSLVLSWDYEQWRFANFSGWSCFGTGALAGNSVLTTKGYIGANNSFLNPATSTPLATFTLSGLSIANGDTFGISWITNDDTGADNGIAIDNFSLNAFATPSITLANQTIAAGNMYQTSVNNVLYRTDVTVAVSPATLTSAVLATSGTYLSSNISNLKLWYSTNAVFSTSTATLLSTKTTGLGTGAKTFSGLSQRFDIGTSYVFMTTDVPCATTPGNIIGVNAMTLGNFSFANGTKTGSGFTATGSQSITALTLNAVANQSICSGKSVAAINFVTFPSGSTVNWANTNTSTGLAATGSGNISSYAAPAVSSNENATISATISNGACIGTSSSFNLQIKKTNQANSAWTGAVSSDWTDSDNWSNCVCGSATDVTVSTTGSNPVINSTANVKNIQINAGSSLSVQSSQALNVQGNWVNNGSFNAQQGSVILSGTTPQTLSGSSTTSFYDLVLSNSNGAFLSSVQQIRGTLYLNSGVFNTNDLLTLAANATESGKIGPINASADIINKVTVQQYAPGGATGWALLGSPISSSLTMADWNDNFPITCLTCPDGYMNFPSIYTYNESTPGDNSNPAKYTPITSITDHITPGVGYWAYIGNGSTTTSAINFDVFGNVAKSTCLSCTGDITIPLSFTSNNGLADDGWNLISNPLPSPISWTALRNGNPDVDDAIYVYNQDLNNGQGAHTSFINGVSSDISGGVSDNIGMCQGFYVHAKANTTLTAGEDVKTDSNPAFLRPAATKPIFRLAMHSSSSQDMTTFYFQQGGTTHFQNDFDAYKLNFSSGAYIGSMSDSILTSISGLPELTANTSVLVKVITPSTESFTFSSLTKDFPTGVCVKLYDSYTGASTNILTNSYVCTLYDTTTVSRFKISFYSTISTGISHINQPSCNSLNGFVSANGSGNGPWDYVWKSGNTVVKTSLNKATSDSLTNLNGGNYSVEIINSGGCDHFLKSFTVDLISVSNASFSADSYQTTLSNAGLINFVNQSGNSQFSSWEFGDNSGTFFVPSPSHNYTSPGTYTVKLITESNTHCKDTAQQVIVVVDDVTALKSFSKNNEVTLSTLSRGNYELAISFADAKDIEISLFDLRGTLLQKTDLNQVSTLRHSIDLQDLSPGMYLLKTNSGKDFQKTFKLLK
ncbi:hypothetical protein CNR22_09585 [Sphingobacteriaceae bacterium]|nr:hypothetical protein CNR22_09585 [Sphingobacteriaceae bacterium]